MTSSIISYYVYDSALKSLGGISVKILSNGAHVVYLTASQAMYWLDQWIIGTTPARTIPPPPPTPQPLLPPFITELDEYVLAGAFDLDLNAVGHNLVG